MKDEPYMTSHNEEYSKGRFVIKQTAKKWISSDSLPHTTAQAGAS